MFVVSILLDLVFSNYLNYELSNISIFPMFTITYIIYELLINKDTKNIIIAALIYSMLSGVIYINLSFILITNEIINKIKNKNYLLITLIALILYDTMFFMIVGKYSLNYLVIKIVRTLPINMLYFLLLLYNYGSKNNEKKYKLNEMITWQQSAKRKKKVK